MTLRKPHWYIAGRVLLREPFFTTPNIVHHFTVLTI
jgi:hypothetical protein